MCFALIVNMIQIKFLIPKVTKCIVVSEEMAYGTILYVLKIVLPGPVELLGTLNAFDGRGKSSSMV